MSVLVAAESPFKWQAALKDGKIIVNVEIPRSHHLYEDSTKVSAFDSAGKPLSLSSQPQGTSYQDEILGKTSVYPGGMTHSWTFLLPPGAEQKASVKISSQGCREASSNLPAICFAPEEQIIHIIGRGRSSSDAQGAKMESSPQSVEKPGGKGFLSSLLKEGGAWLYLAAFLAGLLSALTPCVLPLLPITLAVLGAGQTANRRQAVSHSALYVSGLVASFTVLATIAALGGRSLGGDILGNPAIVWLLVLLLVALSLSMLGLYELSLPNSLQRKLNNLGGGSVTGAFLMGLAGGLLAFPCTGPALAALLSLITVSGNLFFGIAVTACYGAGFGLPLFLMGCGLGRLRPGPYTDMSKSVLGIAILCLSIYGAAMIMPPLQAILARGSLELKVASLLMIVAGFLMGAIHGDGHASFSVKFWKVCGALLLAFGLVWNLKMSDSADGQNGGLNWQRNLAATIAEAEKEQKPVLIDFYADWCPPCKEMELVTFSAPAIAAELNEHWLLVKVDGTISTSSLKELQKKYRALGFPTLVLLSADGAILDTLSGFQSPGELLPLLRQARQNKL